MTDLLDNFDLPAVAPKVTFDLDAMEQWATNAGSVFEWDSDEVLALIAEVRQARLVGKMVRDARSSPNGVHGYEATCHGCGVKLSLKRRPLVGRHSWCKTCKANGEPAAQRARDYRLRRAT